MSPDCSHLECRAQEKPFLGCYFLQTSLKSLLPPLVHVVQWILGLFGMTTHRFVNWQNLLILVFKSSLWILVTALNLLLKVIFASVTCSFLRFQSSKPNFFSLCSNFFVILRQITSTSAHNNSNAFTNFIHSRYHEVKSAKPELSNYDVIRKLAQLYKSLPVEEVEKLKLEAKEHQSHVKKATKVIFLSVYSLDLSLVDLFSERI